MEEPNKPVEDQRPLSPPKTAANQPPIQTSPPATAQESKYYKKMRLIIRDLSPHILQVLRTPDFRNCEAAEKIRQELNILRKLCKENGVVDNGFALKPRSHLQEYIKPEEQPKPFQLGNVSEKQQTENGETPGSYIVGGSAFGWNFITFSGNDPVYYGRTKESFRNAQPTQQGSHNLRH